MKRSHSLYALGALAVVTLVTLQSDALKAQLSAFDWETANCDDKIQEFNSIERKGTVDKLTWVYDGVLDDIFGQTCTIMGNVQGIGYISDSDVLIDPDNMEGLYFSAEGNFYFVTYTAKKTVAYAFSLEEGAEPYAYLSEKGPDLLKMIGNARRLHLGMEATETAPMEEEMPTEEVVEEMAMEEEPAPEEETIDQMEEEATEPEPEESAELVLYRDGKIVNQAEETGEANAEAELTSEEEELEDDPVLQQLLKEQEEFFEETEASEEGEEKSETEVLPEETAEENAEEETVAAPVPAAGLGLTTILSGGAAVILGIGATLFILLKKKKKKLPTEEAPPPTPETTSGTPQQKSDRLEKALAAMDEETEG
jgi:hypothetical protein